MGWVAEAQAGDYVRAITQLRKMGLPATCRARWVMSEGEPRLLMLGISLPRRIGMRLLWHKRL